MAILSSLRQKRKSLWGVVSCFKLVSKCPLKRDTATFWIITGRKDSSVSSILECLSTIFWGFFSKTTKGTSSYMVSLASNRDHVRLFPQSWQFRIIIQLISCLGPHEPDIILGLFCFGKLFHNWFTKVKLMSTGQKQGRDFCLKLTIHNWLS